MLDRKAKTRPQLYNGIVELRQALMELENKVMAFTPHLHAKATAYMRREAYSSEPQSSYCSIVRGTANSLLQETIYIYGIDRSDGADLM